MNYGVCFFSLGLMLSACIFALFLPVSLANVLSSVPC